MIYFFAYYLYQPITLKIKKEKKCSSNIKLRTKISNNYNFYLYFYTYIKKKFKKIIYKNIIGTDLRWEMSSLTLTQL